MVSTFRSVRGRSDPFVDGANVVVARRDDAVAGPELSRCRRRFVPLLLDTYFDPMFAMLGVRQCEDDLMHGATPRLAGAKQHHARGRKVAQLADHALRHHVDHRHRRRGTFARGAALLEFAAHAWPTMRASWAPSRRRFRATACQARSMIDIRCSFHSRASPLATS